DAEIGSAADAALFCAVHDILQSPDALRNVLTTLRPGAWVAAGGGKWAAPMMMALNSMVGMLHAPYVRDFSGFDRPWRHLERLVDDVQVQEMASGSGVTRVWECPGPPGAPTLMLIHGVTFTAELNWGKVFAPLSRHFRVIAIDLRGHGDGISAGPRFRLEDCADDIAALAQVLGVGRFVAVGYSMGGMVAQLLYRRHPSLLSGLVLCATARNVLGSPAERLAALALPTAAATIRWNPFLQPMSAELLGMALMGPVEDPATARQARVQLRRTSLGTAISAIQAVCEFSSHSWIGQVDVP